MIVEYCYMSIYQMWILRRSLLNERMMATAARPIEFKLERTLGEGAFGKVFLCCDKTDSDKQVNI